MTELPNDTRLRAARAWAAAQLGLETVELSLVSGDASFRRYFRMQIGSGSLILMDAPPEHENSATFLDVAGRLRNAGLHPPGIVHFDLAQGFGLLEDLGDCLYRDVLTEQTVDVFFPNLFRVLSQMAQAADSNGLPQFNQDRLQTELDLFIDWYLRQHRQRTLSTQEMRTWQVVCKELKHSAVAQPQVFVHRDFHSCNLLCLDDLEPGIIDFQDAVRGPLSYDFVSLLWDRYIPWPRSQLEQWMESFRQTLALDIDPAEWRRWCDLMGLQRNLKIVGIFARLHYRDHREGYVQMIPRFYRYLLDVVQLYPEFLSFQQLLEQPECAP